MRADSALFVWPSWEKTANSFMLVTVHKAYLVSNLGVEAGKFAKCVTQTSTFNVTQKLHSFHRISSQESVKNALSTLQNRKIFLWEEHARSHSPASSGVARSIIGGGGGAYSYIRVLHFYFLSKSIVFKVCEHEYMNMAPRNYWLLLHHCPLG